MSSVEDLMSLLEKLRQRHTDLESFFPQQIENAYKAVGSDKIKAIAAAYEKVGNEKREKNEEKKHKYVNCPYDIPGVGKKDVIFWLEHIEPSDRREILQKEYQVPEQHSKIIDYFMELAWLGERTRTYEEVFEAIIAAQNKPEQQWGGELSATEKHGGL